MRVGGRFKQQGTSRKMSVFNAKLIEDQRLVRLHAHWHSLAGGKPPPRSAIDPLNFPYLLGNITLVVVEPGDASGPRFRFRLVAENIERLYDRPIAGLYADELEVGSFRSEILRSYRSAWEQGAPDYTKGEADYRNGLRIIYERLVLPVISDGEAVDELVVGAIFSLINPV